MAVINPRYLAYCKANGFENDPNGMLEHDKEQWPGGHMAGFMLWIRHRLSDYYVEHPDVPKALVLDVDHERFDAWLANWSAP